MLCNPSWKYLLFTDAGSFWRRKWQPTSVFLPGKLHGWRRLMACSPWGCKNQTKHNTAQQAPLIRESVSCRPSSHKLCLLLSSHTGVVVRCGEEGVLYNLLIKSQLFIKPILQIVSFMRVSSVIFFSYCLQLTFLTAEFSYNFFIIRPWLTMFIFSPWKRQEGQIGLVWEKIPSFYNDTFLVKYFYLESMT